jgi:hypothetical protein
MKVRCVVLLLAMATLPGRGAEKVPSFLVDDFEDGDRIAKSGAAWIPFSDAIIGGRSTARLSVVGTPGHRSLRAEGSIAEGGFAGTWVALDREARAIDLRAFRAIRLRLRGTGDWSVGLRAGAAQMDNFLAPVSGSDVWTSVEVPLAVLRPRQGDKGPELGEVRWLGVQSAPGRSGDFSLEVDDIELLGAARPASPHGNALEARIRRTPASALAAAKWKPLGTDPAGDGKVASLPDVVALASWSDGDVVWFRVSLASPPGAAFGVNLAFDVDGDPTNGQPWWGANTAFRFDRLVTVWVFDTTEETLEGTIGIASADDAIRGRAIDPSFGAPRVAVDPAAREVSIGVPRAVIAGAGGSVRMLAAVGSPMRHNDDMPDAGAVTLEP